MAGLARLPVLTCLRLAPLRRRLIVGLRREVRLSRLAIGLGWRVLGRLTVRLGRLTVWLRRLLRFTGRRRVP